MIRFEPNNKRIIKILRVSFQKFSNHFIWRYTYIFVLISALFFLSSVFAWDQNKCGGINQQPCPAAEKVIPCRKGLREDFRIEKCVSAKKLVRTSFLKICNNDASEVISFIIVLWDSELRKWRGEGWFRIDDRECTVAIIPGSYQGYVNIYAEMKGKIWSGTNNSFCVPRDLNKIFRQFDTSDCRPPIYKRVELFSILFEPRVSKTYYLKTRDTKNPKTNVVGKSTKIF